MVILLLFSAFVATVTAHMDNSSITTIATNATVCETTSTTIDPSALNTTTTSALNITFTSAKPLFKICRRDGGCQDDNYISCFYVSIDFNAINSGEDILVPKLAYKVSAILHRIPEKDNVTEADGKRRIFYSNMDGDEASFSVYDGSNINKSSSKNNNSNDGISDSHLNGELNVQNHKIVIKNDSSVANCGHIIREVRIPKNTNDFDYEYSDRSDNDNNNSSNISYDSVYEYEYDMVDPDNN